MILALDKEIVRVVNSLTKTLKKSDPADVVGASIMLLDEVVENHVKKGKFGLLRPNGSIDIYTFKENNTTFSVEYTIPWGDL